MSTGQQPPEHTTHSNTSGWVHVVDAEEPAGAEFAHLIDRVRDFQDVLASTRPDAEQSRRARAAIELAIEELGSDVVPETEQISGRLLALPGHGQALIPPIHIESADTTQITGSLVLGRFYLGANGAAHGGVVPLVFDEILGGLAGADVPKRRTAFLHVDYRSITPIGPKLTVRAWVTGQEGRKQFIKGTIHDGDTLCAEAEGLFVELRPGQP
jgi:acyl-coenzyme A thioesterase PaaI-like protein